MQIRTWINAVLSAARQAKPKTIARALALAVLTVVASTSANAGYATARFQDFGTNPYSSGGLMLNGAYTYAGPSGTVVASSSTGPLPSISGSNSAGIPTANSTTNSLLDVFLNYGFQIHGPSIYVSVPVIISGIYQMDSIGTNYYMGVAQVDANVNGAGANYSFLEQCIGVCSKGSTFAGLVSVFADREITINEHIGLSAQSYYGSGGALGGAASASAYIDPYIQIDPNWALTNPGYSVSVSPGFGNAAPTASVPEPASYVLLLSGLGLMAFLGRRKQKNTGL